jgi:hypothetical protein
MRRERKRKRKKDDLLSRNITQDRREIESYYYWHKSSGS